MKKKTTKKLSVFQLLAISFLVLIIIGALLLCLPFATRSGQNTTFINALFTSTSATCVTGLVVYDTNLQFTLFGQIVILCLIQLGGLGFMTFVSVAFYAFKGKMAISQSKLVSEIAGESNFNNLSKLLKRIILTTIICELLGAIILCISFVPDFGAKGIYIALWHSISAFCNAGFDILTPKGGVPFLNLAPYANDNLVLITLSLLILIGGFGFFVWSDLLDCKFKFKKLQLYTKIVLISNLILIVLSTILFMVFDYNNPIFKGYSFFDKLATSFFNASTPRTAGFSILDYNSLSESGVVLTTLLMFIGGNSCSCAGGIKINTLVILFITAISVFRNKQDTNCYNKKITENTIKRAVTIFITYLLLIFISLILILNIEKGNVAVSFKSALFEVISALSTVGLSLSLTPTLCIGSKIVLIILMFAGRVGIFTIIYALKDNSENSEIKKPPVNIMVG